MQFLNISYIYSCFHMNLATIYDSYWFTYNVYLIDQMEFGVSVQACIRKIRHYSSNYSLAKLRPPPHDIFDYFPWSSLSAFFHTFDSDPSRQYVRVSWSIEQYSSTIITFHNFYSLVRFRAKSQQIFQTLYICRAVPHLHFANFLYTIIKTLYQPVIA